MSSCYDSRRGINVKWTRRSGSLYVHCMSIWGLTVERRGNEDQPWPGIWSRTVWDKLPAVSEEFSDSIFRTGGKGTMFLRNSTLISLRLLYITRQKTWILNLCKIWDLKRGVNKDSSIFGCDTLFLVYSMYTTNFWRSFLLPFSG
jgi:hypothetical protein